MNPFTQVKNYNELIRMVESVATSQEARNMLDDYTKCGGSEPGIKTWGLSRTRSMKNLIPHVILNITQELQVVKRPFLLFVNLKLCKYTQFVIMNQKLT